MKQIRLFLASQRETETHRDESSWELKCKHKDFDLFFRSFILFCRVQLPSRVSKTFTEKRKNDKTFVIRKKRERETVPFVLHFKCTMLDRFSFASNNFSQTKQWKLHEKSQHKWYFTNAQTLFHCPKERKNKPFDDWNYIIIVKEITNWKYF